MSFNVNGMSDLSKIVDKLKHIKKPVSVGLNRAGRLWVQMIQQGMAQTPRGSSGHSLPGNFPAVQTGMLSGSMNYTVSGWSSIEVGTNVEYATYLENGTSKMLARPIIGSHFVDKNLKQIFENIVISEIKKFIGN